MTKTMLIANFNTYLKFMFLYLHLLVLAPCYADYESESTGCPLWHVRNTNGLCECGADYDHVVTCDDTYVYVQHGNCITWNNSTNSAVLYLCLYSSLWNTTRDTYRIPNNVSRTKLNDITCKDYNRKGDQCRECIDGYGPALFSDGITCADCSKHRYLWILNLLFQIAMVILLYLLIAFFQINLTSSPLNLTVTFLQFIVLEVKCNGSVHLAGVQYIGEIPTKVLCTFFAVLNLDFFYMVLPPLCISAGIKAVNILMFDYIIAGVPIIFTVFIYICIELYDRNYRLILILSYPIRCLTGVHTDWNPKKRILTTFASMFLLSYTKFLFVSLRFLSAVNLYNSKGKTVEKSAILLYDPAIRLFDSEHIVYAVLTFSVLFIFIILPTIFLALYPTRLFRKVINSLGFQRWDVLAQIMDIFQGWFKDGSNGTKDYRPVASFYFLLRIGVWCEFIISSMSYYIDDLVVTMEFPGTGVALVLCGVLLFTVKPYKLVWMNHTDGMTFTLAGLVWFLVPSGSKIKSIILVGLAVSGIIFISVYHKIYKFTNLKKN